MLVIYKLAWVKLNLVSVVCPFVINYFLEFWIFCWKFLADELYLYFEYRKKIIFLNGICNRWNEYIYIQTSVVFENLKLAEIFVFHVVLLKSRCRKPIKYQLQLLIRLIKSDMVISFMLVIDFTWDVYRNLIHLTIYPHACFFRGEAEGGWAEGSRW